MPYGSKQLQVIRVGAAQRQVMSQPCIVTGIRAYSDNSSPATMQAYVQLFDSAVSSGFTVGGTSPNWVVACVSTNVSDGDGLPTMGIVMERGLFVAATQGAANATSANLNVLITII